MSYEVDYLDNCEKKYLWKSESTQQIFQEADKELEAKDNRINELYDLGLTLSEKLEAKDKLIAEVFREGYEQGHDATVEGCYSPEEATDDYIEELTNKEGE